MTVLTKVSMICVLFLIGVAPNASAENSKEAQVKAAILYNLARFSEWPEPNASNNSERFTICAQTNDPILPALDTLNGKRISGRRVEIIERNRVANILTGCQVIYFSKSLDKNFNLETFSKAGILSVGETETFLVAGGGISIFRTDKRLGFSINKSVLVEGGIRPSSKILSLAREVR